MKGCLLLSCPGSPHTKSGERHPRRTKLRSRPPPHAPQTQNGRPPRPSTAGLSTGNRESAGTGTAVVQTTCLHPFPLRASPRTGPETIHRPATSPIIPTPRNKAARDTASPARTAKKRCSLCILNNKPHRALHITANHASNIPHNHDTNTTTAQERTQIQL
jgi:hypothetical protein